MTTAHVMRRWAIKVLVAPHQVTHPLKMNKTPTWRKLDKVLHKKRKLPRLLSRTIVRRKKMELVKKVIRDP